MIFRDPLFFTAFPFIILFMFFALRKDRKGASVKFSSGAILGLMSSSIKLRVRKGLIFLRTVSFVLIMFAMARPQSPMEETEIISEGVDIVLAIDVSTSMLAEDFEVNGRRQNRIEAVKDVVKDFIEGRSSDRIGMVAFAARAYTICPLTLDYGWLLQNLDRVETGLVEDGTAIGSGISAALNRLVDTQAKGKVIILLTDGINNTGKISPLTAAEAAKAIGIKIYTIGAGTKGLAPYPVKDVFGNTVYKQVKIEIDEDTLKKIASITEGKYFRAENTEALRDIYKEIDRLERVPIQEKGYMEYKELFYLFLLPGLFLLLLEIFLSNTILRKIP